MVSTGAFFAVVIFVTLLTGFVLFRLTLIVIAVVRLAHFVRGAFGAIVTLRAIVLAQVSRCVATAAALFVRLSVIVTTRVIFAVVVVVAVIAHVTKWILTNTIVLVAIPTDAVVMVIAVFANTQLVTKQHNIILLIAVVVVGASLQVHVPTAAAAVVHALLEVILGTKAAGTALVVVPRLARVAVVAGLENKVLVVVAGINVQTVSREGGILQGIIVRASPVPQL